MLSISGSDYPATWLLRAQRNWNLANLYDCNYHIDSGGARVSAARGAVASTGNTILGVLDKLKININLRYRLQCKLQNSKFSPLKRRPFKVPPRAAALPRPPPFPPPLRIEFAAYLS